MTDKERGRHIISDRSLRSSIGDGNGLTPWQKAVHTLELNPQTLPQDKILGNFNVSRSYITTRGDSTFQVRLERRGKIGTYPGDTTEEQRRKAREAVMLVGRVDKVNGQGVVNPQDVENPGAGQLIFYSIERDGIKGSDGEKVTPATEKTVIHLIDNIGKPRR